MKVLCTICGRGGSIGIRNKALQKIHDKPLISYTIRQAIKAKIFDEIVVRFLDLLRVRPYLASLACRFGLRTPKNP